MKGLGYWVFPVSLAATILIEGGIVALWFHKRDYIYYSLLCNLLTNPALNVLLLIVVRVWGTAYYTVALAALEIAVVLIEARVMGLLCGFRPAKALLVSCAMNAGSFLTGLLLFG